MNQSPQILASLTRITALKRYEFEIRERDRATWRTGDYVAMEVLSPQGALQKVELVSGRHRLVELGDIIVGAFGKRHATLEATGTWEAITNDNRAHLLTAAGLIGKCTSRSPYLGALMDLRYRGHVVRENEIVTMRGSVDRTPLVSFDVPVILIVGTSMSAGKTSAATKVIRRLRANGLVVTGAKLTGAGRQRDILSFKDAGAQHAYSFVDVGLPSTVVDEAQYREILPELLSRIASDKPDVAVVEIGSSPLEAYNGETAIASIQANVRASVLCASDPYSVVGAMTAFDLKPTFVTGIATNTIAGIELIKRLTGLPALNLFATEAIPEMWELIRGRLYPATTKSSHELLS